ncbi:MAG: cysteine hydrolase family protein [Deltaproteobacteria bacterium]|nr:MAG: cysteine hydrolase family protein [Deltaproteobacteria bacterium]
MQRATTCFWDGDTQRDFLEPAGALYVPASERIIPNLGRLTRLARAGAPRIRVVGTVCRHFAGDAELAPNGGPYPPHCLDGTPGQRKIDATAPVAPRWIENRAYARGELDELLGGEEVFIEKQDLDPLIGNRNTAVVLPRLLEGVDDVVIYGVVTEICIDRAVRALLGRGPSLHVVRDAIAPLDEARGRECEQRWQAAGVELITTEAVARALR